jgi:hypothetical protein
MKTGIELIAEERARHYLPIAQGGEGWTPEHDDMHAKGEMAQAAIHYAELAVMQISFPNLRPPLAPIFWPWDEKWWKPKDQISNLKRAAALLASEIDRLQRLKPPVV